MKLAPLAPLALALSLLTPAPAAQRAHTRPRVDPMTGRSARTFAPPRAPRRTTQAPSLFGPRPVGVEGKTIGYSTEFIVPHDLRLTFFPAASQDLVDDGFTLVPVDSLDAAALENVDILFLGLFDTNTSLDALQTIQILQFVLSGGALVFLGENNLGYGAGNVSVGGPFGLEFPDLDPDQDVLTDVRLHPLTRKPLGPITSVRAPINQPGFFGSIADPGPFGKTLVAFEDGSAHVVVIEPGALAPGSGRVLFVSEANTYLQDYFLGNNRELWRNLFAYDPVSLHFEVEDDFTTPLLNGHAVASPNEFGRLVDVVGLGANFGAAVFDSNPFGPNVFSSDRDLLVQRGNVLILQERGLQTVPGLFDFPDDARDGGVLEFDFSEPRSPVCIDLIDICPGPTPQDARVELTDDQGRQRVFDVPSGWTSDVSVGGRGFGTLEFNELGPQSGVQATATATASEDTGFDLDAVVRITVELLGSGAVDNLVFSD